MIKFNLLQNVKFVFYFGAQRERRVERFTN